MDLVAHMEEVVAHRRQRYASRDERDRAKEARVNERYDRKLVRRGRSYFCYVTSIPIWKRPFIHKRFVNCRASLAPKSIGYWGTGVYFTFDNYHFYVDFNKARPQALAVVLGGEWKPFRAAQFIELAKEGSADAVAA